MSHLSKNFPLQMASKTTLHISSKDSAVSVLARALSNLDIAVGSAAQSVSSLTLPSSSQVSGSNTVLAGLAQALEESEDIASAQKPLLYLSLTPFQQSEQSQWLSVSSNFQSNDYNTLNRTLHARTYLINTPYASLADIAVYARIKDTVAQWLSTKSVETLSTFRHIIRWFDLIQHLDWLKVPQQEIITIDPDVDVPREEKKKPEKKETAKKEEKKPAPKEAAAAAAAGGKQEKKKKEKKPKQQPEKKELVITPGLVEFRVGHIQKAIKHPDADALYVSTIDAGDADGPRTVCSGLVKYIPLEEMQNRNVILVSNLKPVTMRGIKSQAMVLCASTKGGDSDVVEIINPPKDAKPGDKLVFEGFNDIQPEKVLNPKKKIWETVQPLFTTNGKLEVVYRTPDDLSDERKLVLASNTAETCKAPSLIAADVK